MEEFYATVSDLPDYLLYDIFQYFTKPELRVCRIVCKHWKNIIDSYFDVVPSDETFRLSVQTESTRFSEISMGYSRNSMENPERKLTLGEFIDNERRLSQQLSAAELQITQDFIENERYGNPRMFLTPDNIASHNIMNSSTASMIVHPDVPPSPLVLDIVNEIHERKLENEGDLSRSFMYETQLPLEVIAHEDECASYVVEPLETFDETVELGIEVIPEEEDVQVITTFENDTVDDVVQREIVIEPSAVEEIVIEEVYEAPEAQAEVELVADDEPSSNLVQGNIRIFEKRERRDSDLPDSNTLELDHCILSKKSKIVTELLKAPTNYEKLKLRYAKVINPNNDLDDFWIQLGRTVTHLDLQAATHENNFINIFEIFPHFFNLETLEINYKNSVNPLKASRFMPIAMPKVPSLILHKLCADHLETFDLFMKCLPGVKLYIKSCNDLSYNEENFMKLVKRHAGAIKDLGMDLLALMLNSYKGFLITQMHIMALENLDCDIKEIESYSYIPSILNVKRDIKSVKLWNCFDFPSFKNLTFLHIKFLQDIKSFKPIEGLPNLQGLEFEFVSSRWNWKCFFGHEVLSCPKLRHIGIITGKQCQKCWTALLDSFHLDSMALTTNVGEFEHLPLIGQKQSLKKLVLQSTELVELPQLNGMEDLKSLSLINFEFNKISVGAGNLKKLHLDGEFKGKALTTVLKEMRKIEKLKIVNLSDDDNVWKSFMFDQILVANCCNHLKVFDINLPQSSMSEDMLKDFFNNCPHLKVINFEDGSKSCINYIY